jgi:hypothetical protein
LLLGALMGSFRAPADAPVLTEPCPAPEIFATGCAGCERVSDGCVRLLLYSAGRPIGMDPDVPLERALVLRLAMPIEAVPAMIAQLGAFLEGAGVPRGRKVS